MVNSILSGNNGIKSWFLQRITAIILFSYVVYIFYNCGTTNLNFEKWSFIFNNYYTKVFSLITIFSILIHAWIGLWTVTTDYIKCIYIRISMQLLIIALLLIYLAWSIKILWSIS